MPNGLIRQAAATPPQTPPPGAQAPGAQGATPPEAGAPGAQGGQADPQTVAAYQRIVTAVGKVIYDKATTSQLVGMVKSAQNPIQGIVAATMVVLDHLKGQIKGINPNFVYAASMTTALLIAELAEAGKALKADPAKMPQYMQALTQALQQALEQRAQGQQAQAGQQGGEQPAGGAEQPGAGAQAAGGGAATPDENETPAEAAGETPADEEEEKVKEA